MAAEARCRKAEAETEERQRGKTGSSTSGDGVERRGEEEGGEAETGENEAGLKEGVGNEETGRRKAKTGRFEGKTARDCWLGKGEPARQTDVGGDGHTLRMSWLRTVPCFLGLEARKTAGP